MQKEMYYKSFWGIKKVKVLGTERRLVANRVFPEFYYKYLIQFPNGKIKLVNSQKIIEIERES